MSALDRIVGKDKLSLGLVFPIEAYEGAIPKMENQEQLAKQAEDLGFKSLWFRDVPLLDPTFGDAGQTFDPWVYMTHIMNHTNQIALATGSIILPLRHPIHTVKSIASLQHLSDGRIIVGVASGDRPLEYPAFKKDLENRSALFRDNFSYIKALQGSFPRHESHYYGSMFGNADLLPKSEHRTPLLVTGHSGQSLEWIAEHGDGWVYYPRSLHFLKFIMEDWNAALDKTKQHWKPFLQSLYIDLLEDKSASPAKIHLGFKSGVKYLVEFLKTLEAHGVNHVVFNLKFSTRPVGEVLEQLGEEVIPYFLGRNY